MYVIPDAYNYYSLDEEIPVDWKIDYSRLHTDSKGIPLFVNTKRGIEKAIPANESVKALKGDMILGVQRIFTYQGQREMICEIGVELAKKEAENARIELTILPEEKGWAGIREYKVKHNEQRSTKKKKCPWISKQAIELWD
ncbi:hypothetical protein [Marinicrinis lubricantis]|uniref:Uncharacterized protein n=1 Tax=Marinicrinis lubricantis TaxID=2086470 RepID=A0ABW1IN06_9BACL